MRTDVRKANDESIISSGTAAASPAAVGAPSVAARKVARREQTTCERMLGSERWGGVVAVVATVLGSARPCSAMRPGGRGEYTTELQGSSERRGVRVPARQAHE